MIKLLFFCVLTALSASSTVFGGDRTSSTARVAAGEACSQDCNLFRDEDGAYHLTCKCETSRFAKKKTIFQLIRERPSRGLSELKTRLSDVEDADLMKVAHNSCRGNSSSVRGKTAQDYFQLASLNHAPLCECVQAKTHFGLNASCTHSQAGEELCNVRLVPPTNNRTLSKPLRSPTFYDYASCLAGKKIYQQPAYCPRTSKCMANPKTCVAGERLVNLADPGACCPAYECISNQSVAEVTAHLEERN